MSRAPAYTPEEKQKIFALHDQGKNYRQIADIIRPGAPAAWRTVKSIIEANKINSSVVEESLALDKPLGSMSQSERTKFLATSFVKSARGLAILNSLLEGEKTLFLEEYTRVHSEMDSLTSAEEQMLVGGILSFLLALRASKALALCEQIQQSMLTGAITLAKDDPKLAQAARSEGYKNEITTRMKEYREVMDKLKATRDKRLEKIIDQKHTFADLITQMTQKEYKESIIDDIIKLSRYEEDELKRLIEGGIGPDGHQRKWLMGNFNDRKT